MLQLQIWVQNLLKLLGKKILQSLFGASIRVKHWGTQMQWSARRADDSQASQVGRSRQCVRMTNAMITRYGRLSTKLATSAQLVPVNIWFPVRDRSESPCFLQQPTFHRDMVRILCKDWGNTRFLHCMSFIHEGESQNSKKETKSKSIRTQVFRQRVQIQRTIESQEELYQLDEEERKLRRPLQYPKCWRHAVLPFGCRRWRWKAHGLFFFFWV